ncbi:hypothetical protein PVAP13_2KG278950 [Panicum virgatum]|uniref:Uncharacterized protein n=1 Tax=Panicum virgatum TaxID=38727 RepID=A0A8T0W970_PANVG|nr:hypothetical protein PVAP13_2KG278950 [Panicum virgatum]
MATGALACALGCGAVNPVSGDLTKPVVTSNSISSLVCHRADVSGAPPPTPPVPALAHPLHVPLPLLIPSFLLGFASEASVATPMPVSSQTAVSRPGASLLPLCLFLLLSFWI